MKINYKLLQKLYLVNHPSKMEHEMLSLILNYCYKIPKLTFYIDHYGNLFITKNTTNPEYYPCVIAHMDQVHDIARQKELVLKNRIVSSQYVSTKLACGLGADDANGILVAIQLLEAVQNLKVVFTVEEEIGGIGASEAVTNLPFFENVSFFIQADRRGSSDLITFTNGIESASSEFVNDISDIMEKYYYSEGTGTFTDVGVFAEECKISGVNVSCGYYNEHTTKECCNLDELENCLNFIYAVIQRLANNNKQYAITVIDYASHYDWRDYYRSNNSDNRVNAYSSTSNNDPYELPCDTCIDFDCMNCTKIEQW